MKKKGRLASHTLTIPRQQTAQPPDDNRRQHDGDPSPS